MNAAVRDATVDTSNSNSGYPIYAVSDIATQGSADQVIPVEQPRIYYGEVIAQSDPDYAVVGATPDSPPREYDTDTSTYTYTGAGGVPIGNWLNRLAFAAKYAERNLLFSRAIGADSKILFHRDPVERVQHVAPWLTTDANPYPAVVAGKIVWIIDAYTTLGNYPYAQRSSLDEPVTDAATGRQLPREEISYARNSVKATVDAYDGTVTLYQVDDQDPVLTAWMNIFPGTVQPQDTVPEELRAHFRYPEDLFEYSGSCWPNITWTSPGSSSPPTPSGRCQATRPWRRTRTSDRSTCWSETSRARNPRSGWPAQWWGSTASSSPRTSPRIPTPRTTARSPCCGCRRTPSRRDRNRSRTR